MTQPMPMEPEHQKDDQIMHAFGEFSMIPTQQLELPNGLPGFEHLHHFQISELEDFKPFSALLSVEEPAVSMLVIHARYLKIWQSVSIHAQDLQRIQARKRGDVDIWVILRTEPETHAFTANVKAPLFINRQTGQAAQIILERENLRTDYPLADGLI